MSEEVVWGRRVVHVPLKRETTHLESSDISGEAFYSGGEVKAVVCGATKVSMCFSKPLGALMFELGVPAGELRKIADAIEVLRV